MNEQQVRQIAEAAFKARFSDVDIVTIGVEPDFDIYDEPLLDVRIVYDAEVERLIGPEGGNGEGILKVRTEITRKVWYEQEDSPVWPQVHLISKSDYDLREEEAAA